MIADYTLKIIFREKDKDGNTLFIPGIFSQRKVVLTSEEEKKLKSFLKKLSNISFLVAILSIPFLTFFIPIYIIPISIIYKIGVKKILKDKA